MRANELTPEQKTKAVERAENAAAILADFQQQHGFELPKPWRECVEALLLGGLGDPELHRIFNAHACTEFEAGRMKERPVDFDAWVKEEKEDWERYGDR